MTKSQVLDCFKKYLSPSSSERAKLSVYLYAQGHGQDAAKSEDKEATAPEDGPSGKEETDLSASNETAANEAVEILDVYAHKVSLVATPGARPVKDLSEYEDVDAKL